MNTVGKIDSHDLVSSKENIQPLRRGRDTSKLCAALQAETDSDVQQELEKQRNEFEIKLRSTISEDPLSHWCDYIHWIEQSFPKRGEDGKLNVVLKKCLKKFKDNQQYANDIRFVKLCIKYAELEENTVELLSQIHRHGIGVNCAEMYIAWAEKYAMNNCFKKANAIYERGVKCSAQPVELLQKAYQEFQAFFVRKMLEDSESLQPNVNNSNSLDRRQPYNKLQTVSAGQKEVIPSIRTGSSVIGPAGKLQKVFESDHQPKSNAMIKIFEDTEGNVLTTEPIAKLDKIQSRKTTTKENTVKAGPWCNKKNKHVPFKIDAPNSLAFQVHRDTNDEINEVKIKTVPSTVLKSHKGTAGYEDEHFANAPLFYPEPYDPTKKPMYCKEQVYAGGLEFQFEELRAIQYRIKKQEEIRSKCMIDAKPCVEVILPISQQPQHQISSVTNESHPKPKINKGKPKTTELVEKNKTKTLEAIESCKLKSNDPCQKKEKNNAQAKRKTIYTDPVSIPIPEEHLSSTDYSMNQTIHTKEALSEMQRLWFSKPPSPVPLVVKTAKPACKSILKPSKPCFNLYVDESCLENFKHVDNVQDENKPLDLTFKVEDHSNGGDDTGKAGSTEDSCGKTFGRTQRKVAGKIFCPRNNKENCFDKENLVPVQVYCDEKLDDENKENGVPDDYCGPVGKSNRKVSGILTPAENVEIAQLSDEEVEVEVDDDIEEVGVAEEDDEAPANDFSSIIPCNVTAITETWNFTKGFQFPRGESTPNTRKLQSNKVECDESYLPDPKTINVVEEQSENNLQIQTKKETDKENCGNKKKSGETENCNKNLSVIAETSREYRSSSSASSNATGSLASRHSKNFPYTPSDAKNLKLSLITSQTTFYKGKTSNYTSYEASSESSQTAVKTPLLFKEESEVNRTINLMNKLNAIERTSESNSFRKEEGIEDLSRETSKLAIEDEREEIDPFSEEVIEKLLLDVEFPGPVHSLGYFLLSDVELPALKLTSTVTLGAFNYKVKKILGEGSYARIFNISNCTTEESWIAKYQKPAFPWEFYITREIQARIGNSDLMAMFMNVEFAYFFKNCSILLTRPVEFGDLLAVIKKMQEGKMMCQMLAMHFTCQILKILETLHSCKIIHGDIKPDNFLLRNHNSKLQLQLIDFGRSIDMSLFPEGTTFTRVVTTEGFTTVEMKTGRPWTYQIDYYGAAVCGHCLLFGEYMKVVERNGVWNISKTIPRYWAKNEWRNFFTSLINVESCGKLPDLAELRRSFEDVLSESSEIEFGLYKLNNLLNNR